MSRSNHNYFKICDGPPDADGYCEWHAGRHKRTCILAGDVVTRRGVFRRRKRFPWGGIKSWHRAPPMELKKAWHRRARARQRDEFRRSPEDPLITPFNRLIDLWDWY